MQRHSKYIAGALLLGLMLPSLSFAAERGAFQCLIPNADAA
jgi:hypothetical protein